MVKIAKHPIMLAAIPLAVTLTGCSGSKPNQVETPSPAAAQTNYPPGSIGRLEAIDIAKAAKNPGAVPHLYVGVDAILDAPYPGTADGAIY